MFTFLVDLMPQAVQIMPDDPRGGRIPNVGSDLNFNNLHVPYRGGDFNAPHVDPASGKPLSYIQSLPGLDQQQNSAALNQLLKGILAKQQGLQGGNNQRYYSGMSFGVTVDG